jgi:hypothetical protein
MLHDHFSGNQCSLQSIVIITVNKFIEGSEWERKQDMSTKPGQNQRISRIHAAWGQDAPDKPKAPFA